MGYTDQSGIGLWQHLTLTVCCCVRYVVPIRINNTHLCVSAVVLLKGKKPQELAFISVFFFGMEMSMYYVTNVVRVFDLGQTRHLT